VARRLLNFVVSNIGTLLLSFALAFAVWISAVIADDPNEIRNLANFSSLEIRNLNPELVLVGEVPNLISVELGAPVSLWDDIQNNPERVQSYLDLAGLDAGEHSLVIEAEVGMSPTRVMSLNPETISFVLEHRIAEEWPIDFASTGKVALGFEVESVQLSDELVSVSGAESLISQVDFVAANLAYNDEREEFSTSLQVQAFDVDGNSISGLSIEPQEISAQVAVEQSGGYREVAVAVETLGQPAQGFRVIDITVNPPIVTLFSDNLELIAALPGFVSTLPLDLSNAQENIVSRLALNLPDGVSVEGDSQNVEVSIGISPIESSIPISLEAEVIGLATGFGFEISPASADLILSGPLAILQSLAPGDVRLIVDASNLEAGSHLVGPAVEILPDGVEVLSITPSSLEIIITQDSNP